VKIKELYNAVNKTNVCKAESFLTKFRRSNKSTSLIRPMSDLRSDN